MLKHLKTCWILWKKLMMIVICFADFMKTRILISEIYELREILQNFWNDSSPYQAMIPSVLYLCNKMKIEDEQRFTEIDLVNYMM